MRTQIQKWGNSLAVRIPRAFAAESGLTEGAQVDMTLEDGEIRLKRVKLKYDLDDLIGGIAPGNLHKETDWGDSQGKEAW